ncbi:anacyclamide/piricyclamide family prenylated cyclic peptide [Planktothrix agardhii]|jgi:prenylated cyclic peptide (anacyclamide/piricyclamide family)|uniref:anacyclamide/piricyclamide family prenylated cyclic peptide n=1 Tax=Planktothrix agardhii TaxID=1160 RepID=UPI003969E8CB
MTKKNLKPQQAAPVQREINTTSSESGTSTGLTPHYQIRGGGLWNRDPFAGDDAE